MKALLYSLTLLLFSLSVEAADRHPAPELRPLGFEAAMLQPVPEPVLPFGLDSGVLPVSRLATAVAGGPQPLQRAPLPRLRTLPVQSAIRAPPAAVS